MSPPEKNKPGFKPGGTYTGASWYPTIKRRSPEVIYFLFVVTSQNYSESWSAQGARIEVALNYRIMGSIVTHNETNSVPLNGSVAQKFVIDKCNTGFICRRPGRPRGSP